jgi:Mn2+/Fe2+ NRAMP family transporter
MASVSSSDRTGLITGASHDPSGIGTYAQAGSKCGLSFLWSALLTFPLMAAVQEICGRTAMSTGSGVGELTVKVHGASTPKSSSRRLLRSALRR